METHNPFVFQTINQYTVGCFSGCIPWYPYHPIFDSKIIVFLVNKIPVFHGTWMVPWYPEIRAMISQGVMIAATSVFPFLTSPRLCSNLQCLPAVMDGYFPGRRVTGPEFQRGWEDMKGRRWISIYPLVICDSLPLKMAMKIVDLPINSMVIFHSYVNVYQRVNGLVCTLW